LKGLYLTILDYILWKVFSYQFSVKLHIIFTSPNLPNASGRCRRRWGSFGSIFIWKRY